jgi:arylsulfatase
VDGKEVASRKIPHTIPAILTIDESFDVGVDTRTGVEDRDYKLPFRFTGKLGKITVKLAPQSLKEAKRLQQMAQQALNATQ